MMSMTWKDVWARRLARHSLSNPAPVDRAVEVVSAVCGIQAQVMPAAELSVGTRLSGATRQDIRAMLWERRLLVKTYGIRGTVHLFAAGELPLWMAALRERAALDTKKPDPSGLDPRQVNTITSAIGDA